MAILQFDAVYKCKACNTRKSRCTTDYKCITCGADVKDAVEQAINSVNGMTMLIPILFVVLILLKSCLH